MKRIVIVAFAVLFVLMTFSFSFASETGNENAVSIKNAEELKSIAGDLDGDYVITANITIPSGEIWESIGTPEDPFTGTIDGQGYTITGLEISVTDASADTYSGLFGVTDGAVIKNIRMKGTDINVSGTTSPEEWTVLYAGAVAGLAKNTSFENCYNTGSITLSSTKNMCVSGGIAGALREGSSVISSFNSGNISASSEENVSLCGGICGEMCGGSIINCYNSGTVTATTNTGDYAYSGGIVGEAGDGGSATQIVTCYNSGETPAGIVGSALYTTVENCFSLDVAEKCIGYQITDEGEIADNGDNIRTHNEMTDLSSFTGFDEEIWTTGTDESYLYPTLLTLPHDSVRIQSLTVSEEPAVNCAGSGAISITGGNIRVLYDNGDTENVSFENEDVIIESFDYTTLDEQTISLLYNNYPFEIYAAISHELDMETAEVQEPTCGESGFTLCKCTTCGEFFCTEETPPLEHDYEMVANVAERKYEKHCTICGETTDVPEDEAITYISEQTNNFTNQGFTYADKAEIYSLWSMCKILNCNAETFAGYDDLEKMVGMLGMHTCGDVDMDGLVRAKDISLMLYHYGKTEPCAADIDGDGSVNADDLSVLLENYGKRLMNTAEQ